jgi:ribosomal protein L40E
MDYEAIAEAYLSKKLGNTPKFQSASDKELFSVEPPSPYKCRTCGTKVESGPVAPRGAKQCRDCYQKDMFSKADNTIQYKRHVTEHPWNTDKVARTADDLRIEPKDNVARTADDLKIVVKKSIDFETVATRMVIKAKC